MMIDIALIVASIVLFVLSEHILYRLKCRELACLKIENERLDVYTELQTLCLKSKLKVGDPAHDVLLFMSENYPSIPFWHLVRILFSRKYRSRYEDFGKEIERSIEKMPSAARNMVCRIRALDVKLVSARQPIAFCILLMFIVFRIILQSDKKRIADTESVMNELLMQQEKPLAASTAA